jgi:hypothetical protein
MAEIILTKAPKARADERLSLPEEHGRVPAATRGHTLDLPRA